MKPKFMLLIFICFLTGCKEYASNHSPQIKNGIQMSKRMKIDELKSSLEKLENGQTEFEFIGITSNGEDCIYFVIEEGKFSIEYEAIIENQIAFLDKLIDFSKLNNLETELRTYNNKAQYKSNQPAPVLRIKAKANIDEIAILGESIQNRIFNNSKETTYDIVP